jgi:hypothetical protein
MLVAKEEGEGGRRQHHRGPTDGRERATGSASPMVATRDAAILGSS